MKRKIKMKKIRDASNLDFLSEAFSNSSYFLEKNGYLADCGDEKCVFLKGKNKAGENVDLLKHIPKTIDLSGFWFSDISEEEFSFLEKNYELEFFRISSYDFIYDTKKFVQKHENHRKYKRFKKRNNFKIFSDYDEERVKEMFEEWVEGLESRGDESIKTFEDIKEVMENGDKYDLKKIFLEIDGKLIGFTFGIRFNQSENSSFVCLYNFTLREPRDAHFFLKVERAKLFDSKYFIDSVFSLDNRIARYKLENFKPDSIKKFYSGKILRKK